MAYTPTTWVNDSQPAISAENLNNIESGISALDTLAGSTDISAIGDGTITGAIGTTDISGVGDGTVTGAISTLNSSLENIIGDPVTVTLTWNAAGWTAVNNINNVVTIPEKSGYTYIGSIINPISTYRIISPYIAKIGGTYYMHFYAANTGATSGDVVYTPMYKKQ